MLSKKEQYLWVPEQDAPRYILYMRHRKIPFKYVGSEWHELLGIMQAQFKIPINRRPHTWKL